MSEELNPMPESEELNPTPESDAMSVEMPVASFVPPPIVDLAENAELEDEAGEGAEEEGFNAPEEYVERDKGERRRSGTDVRMDDIDYKNITLLSRFLDRRGRILSRRKTRVSAKTQRRIVREIKRARHLALLPYTADQTRIVRKRR